LVLNLSVLTYVQIFALNLLTDFYIILQVNNPLFDEFTTDNFFLDDQRKSSNFDKLFDQSSKANNVRHKFTNNPFLEDLFELSLQDVQLKESEDLFSNNNNHADILFKFDTSEENEDTGEYNITKVNNFNEDHGISNLSSLFCTF
jgi:hypothetical protein